MMPLEKRWSRDAPAFSKGSLPSSSSSSSSPVGRTERHDMDDLQDGRPQAPEHQTSQEFSLPTLPSPMALSLYSLGIGFSPLLPLRRQLTSPQANSSPAQDAGDDLSDGSGHGNKNGVSEEDILTQDSKDVLMDRLSDLLDRLAVGGNLKGENVGSLHAKVDEMERILASPLPVTRMDGADEKHSYWGLPVTPNPPSAQQQSVSGESSPARDTKDEDPFVEHEEDIDHSPNTRPEEDADEQFSPLPSALIQELQPPSSPADPEEVAKQATTLLSSLTNVIANLQDRKEESDHINALLIDRCETAARRIIELEGCRSDLLHQLEATTLELQAQNDEIDAQASELEHLRLRLRGIEVLVPPDADRELTESIENFRQDYERIRGEMAERRRGLLLD